MAGNVKSHTLRGRVSTVFGANGMSAYEIAVAEGFDGTIDEWLESLKGKDYILTDEDKAEIVQGVIAEFPIYNGEVR